jgi:hypothetical protein
LNKKCPGQRGVAGRGQGNAVTLLQERFISCAELLGRFVSKRSENLSGKNLLVDKQQLAPVNF